MGDSALTTSAVLLMTASLLSAVGDASGTGQQSPPVLRSSVDLVTIDVQVTAAKDAPLRQFAATADVYVEIAGPTAGFTDASAPAPAFRPLDRLIAHFFALQFCRIDGR